MKTKNRRRLTSTERQEMQREALSRAAGGMSMANWVPIIEGFTAKGIPEDQIRPRENVFTYHAWRALGRQVRRGEHGVKVTTMVPMTKKDEETGQEKSIGRHFTTAVVFHISQTEPMNVKQLDARDQEHLAKAPRPAATALFDDPGYIEGGNYQ